MSFLTVRRTIGFKKESVAYTAETLAATDFNVPAYAISYDSDIAMYARKLARGDMSRDISVSGKRGITIKFSVDLAWSGTAATAPTYFKCLEACAMKQTTFTSVGVNLVTNADYSKVPATIEIVEMDEGASPSQVVVKARGCMGNAKLILGNVGEAVKIEFEFKGVLTSITDRAFGSILVPTAFDSTTPDAVLSASIKIFAEAQTVSKVTIDLGNDVQLFSDPSKSEGWQGAHVVDRNPTIEMDSDLELIATNADYARLTGNTTGAFTMDVGSNLTLSAPAVQIIKAFSAGDREGHSINNKSLELKRSSGNDEFKILQGAEA